MATVQHRIRRPRASLLIIVLLVLLVTPALAQDERPPVSIPQPERRLATPTPGSPLTVVQVSYKYAVKERDYLSLAVQELVSFTRISTQLEVPLHSRVLTLDDPRIADALMLYMTGFDCSMHIDEQRKARPRPLPAQRRPALCRGYLAPRGEFTRIRWRSWHPLRPAVQGPAQRPTGPRQ